MTEELIDKETHVEDDVDNDLDGEDQGSYPNEGSQDEGEFDIPEEYQDTIDKLVEQGVNDSREKDADELRALKERVAAYESVIEKVNAKNEGSVDNDDDKEEEFPDVFSPEELEVALQSSDTNALSGYLNKSVKEGIRSTAERLTAKRIKPIEQAVSMLAQISSMDGEEPDWRSHISDVQEEMKKNPKLSLKEAYERAVKFRGASDENAKLREQIKKLKQGKRKQVADTPTRSKKKVGDLVDIPELKDGERPFSDSRLTRIISSIAEKAAGNKAK